MFNEKGAMNNENDMNRDPVFHERIDILKNQGYRGFTISGGNQKWGGVKIIAENAPGKNLMADGETNEEAYKKIIDLIDLFLD